MKKYTKAINSHYSQTDLIAKILAALQNAGKAMDTLTRDDFASFDEYHIRGRKATRELAQLAGLREGIHVLDIGSGVGGPARTLAAEFGCYVTGLELVEEYYHAAEMLTARVGLSDQVTFRHGNALDMPFDNKTFDVVWTQHMSMNIEDKGRLFSEIRRVLRPGGRLALYEVCAGLVAPPHFPVPWASNPAISFLVSPDELYRLLDGTGFKEVMWLNITPECVAWFRNLMAKRTVRPASPPPPLGIDLVIGPDFAEKGANVVRNMTEDRIAVIQAVFEREE